MIKVASQIKYLEFNNNKAYNFLILEKNIYMQLGFNQKKHDSVAKIGRASV